MSLIEHGGPDGGAAIRHDFSTNANPLGPPPALAAALQAADRGRYPDPDYRELRETLARWHQLSAQAVLTTAGTSEAIRRLSLAAQLQGVARVWLPQPGYGDYRAAALALGLDVQPYADGEALLQGLGVSHEPALVWLCEPSNPTGRSLPPDFWRALAERAANKSLVLALDRAYEPLRLFGADPVPPALARLAWQCHSPNKALGLTGVRAGYLIAPAHDPLAMTARLHALAPSWVLSAEGLALLMALPAPDTQAWLQRSRVTLADWAQRQRQALDGLGWQQQDAVVPFWLARPDGSAAELIERLRALRAHGIKLRDAASFGLPGWVRVSVQPPLSQKALVRAWQPLTMPAMNSGVRT